LSIQFCPLIPAQVRAAGALLNWSQETLRQKAKVALSSAIWDGVPFDVEWHGKRVAVFVHKDDIADLGRLHGDASDAEHLRVLEEHMERVLTGLRMALQDGVKPRPDGRLPLPSKYIIQGLED
jgi:hypothetical protein